MPVFHFHGAPSSRLEPLLLGDERLARLGLRVIAPDRPGIGGSDFVAGRGFSAWPADVVALADALGLETFSVIGISGGGPYALVCAARIPGRLRSVVIVSGGWRMDWPEARDGLPFVHRLVMTLARRAPWLLRVLLGSMGGIASGEREKELAQMKKRMPAADYEAFAQPGRLEAYGATMREALRQGTRGAAHELGLYVRPFDFEPAEIRMPLTLFHGTEDVHAPIAMARRLAGMLPTARLVVCEGEAHLSTLCNRFDAIAAVLKGAPPS